MALGRKKAVATAKVEVPAFSPELPTNTVEGFKAAYSAAVAAGLGSSGNIIPLVKAGHLADGDEVGVTLTSIPEPRYSQSGNPQFVARCLINNNTPAKINVSTVYRDGTQDLLNEAEQEAVATAFEDGTELKGMVEVIEIPQKDGKVQTIAVLRLLP
jgi:hypothetical protein